jgi:hypothetical protein
VERHNCVLPDNKTCSSRPPRHGWLPARVVLGGCVIGGTVLCGLVLPGGSRSTSRRHTVVQLVPMVVCTRWYVRTYARTHPGVRTVVYTRSCTYSSTMVRTRVHTTLSRQRLETQALRCNGKLVSVDEHRRNRTYVRTIMLCHNFLMVHARGVHVYHGSIMRCTTF